MMTVEKRIQQHLEFLYGPETGAQTWPRLSSLCEAYLSGGEAPPTPTIDERAAFLITYGDSFQQPGVPPLQTLGDFLDAYLGDLVSGVHLLPFFPYSSDDGFSVIDYRQVNPSLGGWEHIHRLSRRYSLIFDLVLNHISRESAWFQAFLRAEHPYRDYFITPEPDWDLSRVVRPRTLPLLTEVQTAHGPRQVWTTFSPDQIDLNYANPQVLLELVDLVLFYLRQGASLLRLDAIAYLWKEPGTTCLHLPRTHAVVKLLRAVLDWVAPEVLILTETNVPHEENLSYFGEVLDESRRTDEAQLVYNFSLAPLVLHAFMREDASKLSAWAASLNAPGPFFNFIASHDGIGVLPAQGLLPPEEIEALVQRTLAHGGRVSYKSNRPGLPPSPYELNTTLYDLLNDPQEAGDEAGVRRFLTSQSIMLALRGVPGIYVHSLFGSSNWQAGLELTGQPRSLNRQKFDYPALQAELENPDSRAARVLNAYRRLLEVRRGHAAFHPSGGQQVLPAGLESGDEWPRAVFALQRSSPDGSDTVLCLANVSTRSQRVRLDLKRSSLPAAPLWADLLSGERYHAEGGAVECGLEPNGYAWLAPSSHN